MISALGFATSGLGSSLSHGVVLSSPGPGARCLKAPQTFRARKAIFSLSVSKNREVYMPETSCLKRTSAHIVLDKVCLL